MKVFDISVPLRADMPTYSGEPGPRLGFTAQLSKGDPVTVSVLSLGPPTAPHGGLPGAAVQDAQRPPLGRRGVPARLHRLGPGRRPRPGRAGNAAGRDRLPVDRAVSA